MPSTYVWGILLKFGFFEKATKFEKNLHHTFDKSFVFCARNSILVKSTKTFQTNVDKLYYSNFTNSIRLWPHCGNFILLDFLKSSFI